MSSSNFLPDREAELVTWTNSFSEIISDQPTAVSLTAAQATEFAALNAAWIAAFNACNNESTDSTSATILKSQTKAAVIAKARELARIVQSSPSVTDVQRAALGLTVPDSVISYIPVPTIRPTVMVKSVVENTVELRLIDQANPTRRGRPADIAGASIYSFVGPTPPVDTNGWFHQGNSTRMQFGVSFPAGLPAGTLVHFRAFYFNAKCQSGPASVIATTSLNGILARAA